MSDKRYYDGTKLLSLKDLNGNTPAIYMCTSNRTAGKTTYFSRLLINRYLKTGSKFCLLYRYKNELENIVDKFYKDINTLFFPEYTMDEKLMSRGAYTSLTLNGEECGYAVALNSADNVKKMSHLFSDVGTLFMDEFQSETNSYCPKEIEKLMSIYTSMARGQGKQSRYIPLYMCSNNISLLNPYYSQFGVAERLREDTKFLRGVGWVLEANFNQTASEAMELSPFMQAFSDTRYHSYASKQGVYLNDNTAFIEQVTGRNKYLCTLHYNGADYAVREYADLGILYCDTRADKSFPIRIAVTLEDHNINYVMLQKYRLHIDYMRHLFELGCFRFKNLKCKEAIFKTLTYY